MLIEEIGQTALDVLLPDRGPDLERLFDKRNPDQLRVPLSESGAFKRRLNASGWFDEEVVAGGLVTQGKAQSLVSMMTGWALVEVVRARRFKSLPREFGVAVTPTRVVALALSTWSEGGDISGDVVVKVKREPVATWSRRDVRVEPDDRRLRTGHSGGTLELGGGQRIHVIWDHDHAETQELIALLGR